MTERPQFNVPFVDDDGTMSIEAYALLQSFYDALVDREAQIANLTQRIEALEN